MKYAYILIAALMLLAGCQQAQQVEVVGSGTYREASLDISGDVNTDTFKSEEELKSFFQEYSGSNNYYGGFGVRMMDRVAMETTAVEDSAPSKAGGDGGLDYSETNVQVEGVDEADIIKTDGDYIYTVSGKTLFIVKAYPGEEAEVISQIELNSTPTGLFIAGDTLAVFGNLDNQYYDTFSIRPSAGISYFKAYDVGDRESPELLKEFEFEGGYMDARMYQGNVYLVTRTWPDRPVPLPIIREDGVERKMPVDSISHFNIGYDNPQMASIHAIDMDDFGLNSKSLVVEGDQNLYMSTDNLYITYTDRVNEYELEMEILKRLIEPELTEDDRELIEKIKKTDNDVLSQGEKEQKILQVYQRHLQYMSQEERDEFQDELEEELKEELEKYDHFEYTVINKVGLDDGEIDVQANGKVPGHIINQFSLDEQDDVLRIATTVSPRWDRFGKERTLSSNNIYTLDEELDLMDSLEGLAEDEQIYSTRFMGDRLYMVTFKQVDPFFVIDLSDPDDIENLGELKITGFSRYLHPYDDDTIIGIGQEATETGRTTGLKISLFDVSDVSDPQETAKFVTEERYASSTALYEHHAFLFDKEKELLVIPAYSYDYEDGEGYNGAFVFHIEEDEIELRGLIDHSQGSGRYYGAQVERSLYIEDLLYTKSPTLLRINEIDDLSSVNNVTLKTTNTDIPVY